METFTAYALFTNIDGIITRVATVATLEDAALAKALNANIVARPIEVDFDPTQASHLR